MSVLPALLTSKYYSQARRQLQLLEVILRARAKKIRQASLSLTDSGYRDL